MTGDVILGFDGASSDEIVTTYIRRGGRLIAECWGSEREVAPGDAAAELDSLAHGAWEMAEMCRKQGGDAGTYPARELAARRAAEAIRVAFPAAFDSAMEAARAIVGAAQRHHEHHGTTSVDESLMTIIDEQIAEDDAAIVRDQASAALGAIGAAAEE